MTRRFLHNTPWSSLLDAWSEVHPRLRYTIHVRDDRPPFKQAARSAPLNSAVARRGLLGRQTGARSPIYATTPPARTAKSCGLDAPTLASSSRSGGGQSRLRRRVTPGDGGKRVRSPRR